MLRYDVFVKFSFTCLTQDTTTGGHLSIFVTRYGHEWASQLILPGRFCTPAQILRNVVIEPAEEMLMRLK